MNEFEIEDLTIFWKNVSVQKLELSEHIFFDFAKECW